MKTYQKKKIVLQISTFVVAFTSMIIKTAMNWRDRSIVQDWVPTMSLAELITEAVYLIIKLLFAFLSF